MSKTPRTWHPAFLFVFHFYFCTLHFSFCNRLSTVHRGAFRRLHAPYKPKGNSTDSEAGARMKRREADPSGLAKISVDQRSSFLPLPVPPEVTLLRNPKSTPLSKTPRTWHPAFFFVFHFYFCILHFSFCNRLSTVHRGAFRRLHAPYKPKGHSTDGEAGARMKRRKADPSGLAKISVD